MPHVITGETLAVREELGQTKHLVERRFCCRQTTLRLGQELTLAVDHLHAEATCIGMAVHEGDTLREGVVLHHRIGIEQENVLTGRNPNRLIVRLRKAHIVLVDDDLYLGKLLRQHLQRAIDGVVVDDKHLALNALHGALHRMQALLEEILDIVVDDDDREFHIFSCQLSASSYQLGSIMLTADG